MPFQLVYYVCHRPYHFFSLLETFMNKSRLESGECYKRPFKLLAKFHSPPSLKTLWDFIFCAPFSFLLVENTFFLRSSRLHKFHFLCQSCLILFISSLPVWSALPSSWRVLTVRFQSSDAFHRISKEVLQFIISHWSFPLGC